MTEIRKIAAPPDPVEVERWQAERARIDAARAAKHAQLLGDPHQTIRHVVELHAPVQASASWLECHGCDVAGYDAEPPWWPCATWRLLAGEDDE